MAAAPAGVKVVVLDLDDTLVPWQTIAHWQWAWRPRGPVLSERRTLAAIHRALHDWDRRRWRGLVGSTPPVDAAAYRQFLGETLAGIAGHALPTAETDAVIDRFLKPAGEIESFPEVPALLRRLEELGIVVTVTTGLPEASARNALHRVGLGKLSLGATAERPSPGLPASAAYRSVVHDLKARPSEALYVGDLFWSDVRAAARAGLHVALVDRHDWATRVLAPRLKDLSEVPERALHPTVPVPEAPDEGPESPESAGGPPA